MTPDQLADVARRMRTTPTPESPRFDAAVAELLEKYAAAMRGTSYGDLPFEAEVAAIATAWTGDRL